MNILGKFLIIFLFAEILQFCISKNENKHNYGFGTRSSDESLLSEVILQAKPKYIGLKGASANAKITFDTKKLNGKRITAIHLEELEDANFGTAMAYVQILDGGINDKEVTMRLTSKRGYGFKYRIQVYGREFN